jgi:hypothetical protein
MEKLHPADFASLYAGFQAPIAKFNCGDRCAPYNERGVPFCCDTHHAVPAAYQAEWEYLQANTDLWHLWEGRTPAETSELTSLAPQGQVLIACLGHTQCQRGFRSLTCRSFPFFPYITRAGEFIGLSYYWEYEDRCWVISNLQVASREYLIQFIQTYDRLFLSMPAELEVFRAFSTLMRRVFGRQRRAIPLLHRSGSCYKITPKNGRLRRVAPDRLPRFGVYKLAAALPFPDELPQRQGAPVPDRLIA